MSTPSHCQATKADGVAPSDAVLTLTLDKAAPGTFKADYDPEVFVKGKRPLEYLYSASSPAEIQEGTQGLLVLEGVGAKAGGKVKGQGVVCFVRPDPNAAAPAPEGEEPETPWPPPGDPYAVAGKFEIDFCFESSSGSR